MCSRRAGAQASDWVCRASWRRLSQPDLPPQHLSALWPQEGWHCAQRWLGSPRSGCLTPGCCGCGRSLSPAAPGHSSGWSGSVYLQQSSRSGRSGAATPRTSSFPLRTVWARDPGQRNPGWWGCWSPAEREPPRRLPVSLYSRTHWTSPTVCPSLPMPACLFLTEPCQRCVSECLTKALLNKDTCIDICASVYIFLI